MPSIIKKGTNPSAFTLRNGKTIILAPDVVSVLSEKEFDDLIAEYGSFIKERRVTDANPAGCFLIHDSREYVEKQNAEIKNEITDASAPIEVKAPAVKKRKKK